ncbi:unnamed protein product, partial [Laminaria digitata]
AESQASIVSRRHVEHVPQAQHSEISSALQSCTTELLAVSSRQLRHIIHLLYPFHMFYYSFFFSRHLACDLSPLPEHGCRRALYIIRIRTCDWGLHVWCVLL